MLLLLVAGDASTSEACLQKNDDNDNTDDNGTQAASTVGAVGTLSKWVLFIMQLTRVSPFVAAPSLGLVLAVGLSS